MRGMLISLALATIAAPAAAAPPAGSATNPLWSQQKVKNYLPDMTWPEVADLLQRTDMVIIPVAALGHHALHGPIGTDFYNANEQAKLVAKRTDLLVARILLPGNSPYLMDFPGTITLKDQEAAIAADDAFIEAWKKLRPLGAR